MNEHKDSKEKTDSGKNVTSGSHAEVGRRSKRSGHRVEDRSRLGWLGAAVAVAILVVGGAVAGVALHDGGSGRDGHAPASNGGTIATTPSSPGGTASPGVTTYDEVKGTSEAPCPTPSLGSDPSLVCAGQ